MTQTDICAETEPSDADDEWSVLDSLPGHLMMWVLIFSELLAFGALLGGFAVARMVNRAVFDAGQAQLDPMLAGFNTFVLLLSGWCAARGTASAHAANARAARAWLVGAIALGAGFIALKIVEYADDLARGLDFETSPFFTLYFLLTGFHLLHVALGMVILSVVAWRARARDVETGAAFWHMVDLVWLLIFPIVYLVR
uniref:Cytochrome c oxidase, subunit III n=1 Tax=Rhodopseudomonas palustris (strain BisA53) TaxID=316055 RepID=Q07U02_RHOP5